MQTLKRPKIAKNIICSCNFQKVLATSICLLGAKFVSFYYSKAIFFVKLERVIQQGIFMKLKRKHGFFIMYYKGAGTMAKLSRVLTFLLCFYDPGRGPEFESRQGMANKFNGCSYKLLIQVRSSRSHRVRPQSRGQKTRIPERKGWLQKKMYCEY